MTLNMNKQIKVRIAPSPTGYLHIGTARTALFNWLFARKNNGKFILRIEDTDLERSDSKYEKDILEGLEWLGLNWDEGPFRQSQRLDIYKKYIQKLLDEEKAFWCFHSIEELERERSEQMKAKAAPRHICGYKTNSKPPHQSASGGRCGAQQLTDNSKKGIIRLGIDQNSTRIIHFDDIIRGDIEFKERDFGDFSIAKDLNTPLYNFAAVVDDYEMEISHVIRGEDHISNTPKQILIQKAFGLPHPQYVHLPLILGPDKSKLSKRHNATSIIEYKKDYLPEALINFMGFLGFTYSKEILTKDKMVQEFNLEKIHRSGAIFNIEKLNWTNSQYIKNLSKEDFKKLVKIESLSDKAVPLITERLEKLSEINNFDYFLNEPKYNRELLIWKDANEAEIKDWLMKTKEILSSKVEWEIFDKGYIRDELDGLSSENRGVVYWPLRVALTGRKESPDPIDIMEVLGRDIVLKRIDSAISKL